MKKILIILITICSLFISCEKEEIVVDKPTFIEEPTEGGKFLYESEFEWVYEYGNTYIDSLDICIYASSKGVLPSVINVCVPTQDYNSINAENIYGLYGNLIVSENAVFANIYNEKVYIYKVLEHSETEYTISGIYKCFNEIK